MGVGVQMSDVKRFISHINKNKYAGLTLKYMQFGGKSHDNRHVNRKRHTAAASVRPILENPRPLLRIVMNKRKLQTEWSANCVGPLSPKQPKSLAHHSLLDDSDMDHLLTGIDFDDMMEVDAAEPDTIVAKENGIQAAVSPNHLFA